MFPALLTRSGSDGIRRIVAITIASLLAFATMVVAQPNAAEAHVENVQVISCLGWSVELARYIDTDNNSVEIWVDDTKVTDIADFGSNYRETGSWDGLVAHTLRVSVVAWDDPDGSRGWTFETTRRSTACPEPGIDIEKATNDEDADAAPGPEVDVDSTVTWTYVVTNTGNVDLTDVAVTDDIEGPICTIGDLAAGASATCTATGTATEGQYANEATTTGSYRLGELPGTVTDKDPSHYIGVLPPPEPEPGIDIEKATNDEDADAAPGPEVDVDSTVTWTYVVTNTGNVDLTDVAVTDDIEGPICTIGDLAAGASATCTATGTATEGQYANEATTTGNYGTTVVTDKDPSHYFTVTVAGTAQLGDTVWWDANKNGIQDNGEKGINGARITLKDSSGTVIATATTKTGPWVGWYKFVGLEADRYTATIDMSSVDGKLTTPGSFTVDLEEGEEFLEADYGLYEEEKKEEELPNTGLDTTQLGATGLMLLVLGLATLATTRRRFET